MYVIVHDNVQDINLVTHLGSLNFIFVYVFLFMNLKMQLRNCMQIS